jgi:hypothetical protein
MIKSVSLRVILHFTNPTDCDYISLTRLMSRSGSLTLQKIYVTDGPSKLIDYSDERKENLKILHNLNMKKWDERLTLNSKNTEFVKNEEKDLE